jgi:hypothetical protein
MNGGYQFRYPQVTCHYPDSETEDGGNFMDWWYSLAISLMTSDNENVEPPDTALGSYMMEMVAPADFNEYSPAY